MAQFEITCAGALTNGQLVSPFWLVINSAGGYYLVRDRRKHANPAMLAFIRWLDALFNRISRELKGDRTS
jgi:DNA-binding transcriptional LysR family regulator